MLRVEIARVLSLNGECPIEVLLSLLGLIGNAFVRESK